MSAGCLLALELPVPLDALNQQATRLTAEHPCHTVLMKQHSGRLLFITEAFAKVMACWCASCESEVITELERFSIWGMRTFIVCPDCGDKRCPRASHHDRACTRSNDPGGDD